PPASPQAQPTEPPKPTAGGTLIVALPAEPDTLNPTLTTMTVARWVLDTVDARLVRIRQDGSDEAELLAEVPSLDNGGISPDGQTYVLHFKPDLAWSDGEALDARDFVFTWRTVTNPSYPAVSRAGWDLITSVSLSADNLTATVRLREPSAAFFDEVIAGSADSAAGFLLPAHVFEEVPVSEIPQSPYGADKHVGSGPFKVAKWQTNEQIVVERNDQYAGEEPKLDRIVFRFVDDPRDALTYLDTGEIDLAPAMPEALIPEFSHVPESFVLATPKAGAVESFAFNLTAPGDPGEPHPILADPAVRRAIALGFDRRSLLERLFPGQNVLAAAPLDNGPWDDPSLSPIPYDPAEARRLLDQAGWR
ncbi:MAG: hypothetical protein IRY97_11345, partial [Thermomicrobiaceae bacterium]|nr:hypothetical protein [Thermomicrobiaceae bacterium]